MAAFPKRTRKLSLKTLTNLHKTGSVLFHHPYKLFYLTYPTPEGCCPEYKIVISVPKRNFKRAVDRNRIKRQIREVFRLNSNTFIQKSLHKNLNIDLLCLYLPNEHTATSLLSIKMGTLLARLARLVAPNSDLPACSND